jgi:fluoroquinolone resistance protein
MDKRSARNRWLLTTEATERCRAISEIILKGGSIEHNLSRIVDKTEQGLLDLRGIPLSLEPGMELNRVQIRDIDFSYAYFGHAILKQCVFEHVFLRGVENSRWNERGCRFVDVDFGEAKLRDAAIGIDGSIYERVSFQDADFSGAVFIRPQFKDCDFSNAKLRELDFNASNFVNCKFRGKLESVWFRKYYPSKSDEQRMGKAVPNEMRNVDFSDASLWDVVFTGGLDLSTVTVPKDGSHILLHHFDTALNRTRNEIEKLPWTDEEKKKVSIWINASLVYAISQPMWILNKKDVEMQFGVKVAQEFLKLLEAFDSSN